MSSSASPPLPPGFRFHPTDEELILYYLCKRAAAVPCPVAIIADINIYNFNPWDLPAKAKFGEREWYFFSPRDRKYPNGVRPNRAAASGYWKATGTDKPITTSRKKENIGVKKALVFYMGKPPKGIKTNWIMHEYRLAERRPFKLSEGSMRLDDLVLCRIYQKTRISSLGEQEAAAAAAATKSANAIQKSLSVSDFLVEEADFSLLSEMLEKPANAPLPPIAYYEPIWELNLGSSFANNIREKQAEASVFASEHCLKRQRTEESNCFDGSNPNSLAQFLDQFGTYG